MTSTTTAPIAKCAQRLKVAEGEHKSEKHSENPSRLKWLYEVIATQVIREHKKLWRSNSKIDYKNLKKETRDSSFLIAAFRLYEPKSREGVLRPESRGPNTTRLLEYLAVGLENSLMKSKGERSGQAERPCLGRVTTGNEHQFTARIDFCFCLGNDSVNAIPIEIDDTLRQSRNPTRSRPIHRGISSGESNFHYGYILHPFPICFRATRREASRDHVDSNQHNYIVRATTR
jgi:hypothetical protein